MTLLYDRVDDELLDAAGPKLSGRNVAVGFDNVDLAAAPARCLVTNTPGVLNEATADLAMARILAAPRRLAEGERLIRKGRPWAAGASVSCSAGAARRAPGSSASARSAPASRPRPGLRHVDRLHGCSTTSPASDWSQAAPRLELDDLLASPTC